MYSILRARKLKNFGAVARSARHTFREQPTPNADPALTCNNPIIGADSSGHLLKVLNELLPAKRRRDAVVCIEYLITASPEAFKRHGGVLSDLGSGYFQDALKWLRHRHGAANVISSTVHIDETTPHLVVYVVPLTKQKTLSARYFLGGPKVMREMQDSFHTACGAPRGLLRGVRGSKAKHDDVSVFYSMLTATDQAPKLAALDYVAKALGCETEAWKKAEALAKANAQGAAVEPRFKKSRRARVTALERSESEVGNTAINLQLRNREMALRERKVEERERQIEEQERVLARRQPELEIALARADAMERLVDQQRLLNQRPAAQPRIHPLDNDFGLQII